MCQQLGHSENLIVYPFHDIEAIFRARIKYGATKIHYEDQRFLNRTN